MCLFSPAGRFLRRIGRKGQGPGEFAWPTSTGWRGDTLWVRDGDLDRVLEATVNAVWGTGLDPDGAPYVVPYRLVRQPGARL